MSRALRGDIFSAEWTEHGYAELLHRATILLAHGESVVADASLINAGQIREQLLWIINRGAAVLIAGSSRDLPRHPVWCGRHLPLSQYG